MNINDAPKPFHWTEYKNDAGEPAARAMRVFDATLWQTWHADKDHKSGGYWNSFQVVVRDIPHDSTHVDAHKKIEAIFLDANENVRKLSSEVSMLGDIVDHLNERSAFKPSDVKIRWRDRLRAAFAAWQEGQH